MESKKKFSIYSNNVKIAEVVAYTKWQAVDTYVNLNNLSRLNLKASRADLRRKLTTKNRSNN